MGLYLVVLAIVVAATRRALFREVRAVAPGPLDRGIVEHELVVHHAARRANALVRIVAAGMVAKSVVVAGRWERRRRISSARVESCCAQ